MFHFFIHRISSDDFIEEEKHLNSNRDPFPRYFISISIYSSRTSVPRRILLGSFVVDPQFFESIVKMMIMFKNSIHILIVMKQTHSQQI